MKRDGGGIWWEFWGFDFEKICKWKLEVVLGFWWDFNFFSYLIFGVWLVIVLGKGF